MSMELMVKAMKIRVGNPLRKLVLIKLADNASDQGECWPSYPGKHPCEKPADMLRQIINASSRPGDLVADFFMGSGSTIKAAMALGRRALGVELESERFNQTVKEINELVGK